jgi:hypothetical protein
VGSQESYRDLIPGYMAKCVTWAKDSRYLEARCSVKITPFPWFMEIGLEKIKGCVCVCVCVCVI